MIWERKKRKTVLWSSRVVPGRFPGFQGGFWPPWSRFRQTPLVVAVSPMTQVQAMELRSLQSRRGESLRAVCRQAWRGDAHPHARDSGQRLLELRGQVWL